MAIIAAMMAASAPAIVSLVGSGDFNLAVDQVTGSLERARSQAMAQNTYTWVGFFEEDAASPRAGGSPQTGTGRLVLCTVTSRDGTKIFEPAAPPATLPDAALKQLGETIRLENIHMSDVAGFQPSAEPASLPGRPDAAYTGPQGEANRLSSDSKLETPFPFQIAGYTFRKTIRFSPSGAASINGSDQLARVGEIGLVATRGNSVPQEPIDLAAIQFSGIGGKIQVYRR